MQIFESHCHLDDRSYSKDLDAVVLRARTAGVQAMMVVGTDSVSSHAAAIIAEQYEGVYAAVGIHPHDAQACNEDMLNGLQKLAGHPRVKAWGETGLDFNRMVSPRQVQEHCFIRQLEIAGQIRLPMIFHERDSSGRFGQLLKSCWTGHSRGVVHCFSGSDAELDDYLEMGLYIGITGILTMKDRGRHLREMARRIPSERLLVETDAPYLTPAPERNDTSRSALGPPARTVTSPA